MKLTGLQIALGVAAAGLFLVACSRDHYKIPSNKIAHPPWGPQWVQNARNYWHQVTGVMVDEPSVTWLESECVDNDVPEFQGECKKAIAYWVKPDWGGAHHCDIYVLEGASSWLEHEVLHCLLGQMTDDPDGVPAQWGRREGAKRHKSKLWLKTMPHQGPWNRV